ncbi:MAG: hypothetical protein EB023_06230 [Flavobacteriia bacterium]|nr:hypothetical protein [Flavobacteriia bacterium]
MHNRSLINLIANTAVFIHSGGTWHIIRIKNLHTLASMNNRLIIGVKNSLQKNTIATTSEGHRHLLYSKDSRSKWEVKLLEKHCNNFVVLAETAVNQD